MKRTLDLAGAALALVLLAPVLSLATLAIWLSGQGPVLFRQERIGRFGRPFTILKLRTFPPAGGPPTRLGWLLRRSSLDELPQLWNVLRGEMSLVGPRPQLACHLPLDCPWRMRRHQCLPGITGLAQVRGRNLLSWSRRFEFDLEYVERRSFLLDLTILLRTLPVVLSQAGASAEQEVAIDADRVVPLPAGFDEAA
ncbi:MAG: sugar transferase [Planctomycetes bacterium]|nr:sugar transferase [Planctomycetota bacterium]